MNNKPINNQLRINLETLGTIIAIWIGGVAVSLSELYDQHIHQPMKQLPDYK
ncbi:hypothetical protein PCCS19_33370 [Paenibacillus sp. CCS19]|uniref:hypothetical protein n=1 Tax=Paenibacillus sp. CCS19 TaxID=3158387 RepID=UPI00255F7E5D|nr:hypothetical protein [Paenibacillus cellulosilyticus]GMK40281.1 hypothetical protein PCCS19_33370 [Paenibacillus cellulosilyticus]